jgi:NADH-quinone oxidoreductase subunit M
MLWLVQRVFYGSESSMVTELARPDMDFRERIAVWPMVVLMLWMGVASPLWMRAIDGAVVKLTQPATQMEAVPMPGMAEKQ